MPGIPAGPSVIADVVGPDFAIPSTNRSLTATSAGVVPFAFGPVVEDTVALISLRTAGKVKPSSAAKKKKAKVLELGSASFQAPKGRQLAVAIRLSKAGRALLKKQRKIKAEAEITLRDALGNPTVKTFRFTVKASKKAKRKQ